MKQKTNFKKGELGFDMTVMLIIALISLFLVILPALDLSLGSEFFNTYAEEFKEIASSVLSLVRQLLGFFGFLALLGFAYAVFRLGRLRTDYIKEILDILPEPHAPRAAERRFSIIKEKALSQNPAERKVAIIEADAMLDEMVKKMGYSGETLADRLKNIETSDFLTLNLAWEAHKFRNKIAHEAHEVNIRDARRIIGLYEQVFQEFTYI